VTNIYAMTNTGHGHKISKQLTLSAIPSPRDWLLFLITITLRESWKKISLQRFQDALRIS